MVNKVGTIKEIEMDRKVVAGMNVSSYEKVYNKKWRY